MTRLTKERRQYISMVEKKRVELKEKEAQKGLLLYKLNYCKKCTFMIDGAKTTDSAEVLPMGDGVFIIDEVKVLNACKLMFTHYCVFAYYRLEFVLFGVVKIKIIFVIQ